MQVHRAEARGDDRVEKSSERRDSVSSERATKLVRQMPDRLVMVRHGESQANLVQRALKSRLITEYPPGFAEIPDREIRLSKLGISQAQITGGWLKTQYPKGFDLVYVSDHTRAKQTCALLCKAAGWNDARIRVDPLLGERNWGRFATADQERRDAIMRGRHRDPLHNPMPDGETLLEARNRSRELLDRAAREFGHKRVLVVSHGEYIEAIWSEIAHFNTESQVDFFSSSSGDIKNCQVVEFSSLAPATSEPLGKLSWVRSSCPQAGVMGEWQRIERREFTPEELLFQADRYPDLDFGEGQSSV